MAQEAEKQFPTPRHIASGLPPYLLSAARELDFHLPVEVGSHPQVYLKMWAIIFPFVRNVITCYPRRPRGIKRKLLKHRHLLLFGCAAIFARLAASVL